MACSHESTNHGCKHYERGAHIIAPCCDKEYACRFCHNDEEMHEIDRRAIKEMICMSCNLRQPISNICINNMCGKTMARYYCDVCKFLDDSSTKDIFHCDKCGICRVKKPGVEYYHCDTCNMCLDLNQLNNHKCIERVLESNCPVCSENMHSSVEPCSRLRCGHFIHTNCLNDYMNNSNKHSCPTCNRTILDEQHMKSMSRQIDAYIRNNPTPHMYRHWKTEILCNDCLVKDTVSFQITQYHKCNKCKHYNTTVVGEQRPEAPLEDEDDDIINIGNFFNL